MVVAIFYVLALRNIIHPAYRALASSIATAAVAVHGADIGRGVFFAFAVNGVFVVLGGISTGRNKSASGSHSEEKEDDFEFFHDSEY